MRKKQRVEIMFDVARGEGVTFELDEENSQTLIQAFKDGKEVQKVFFPDYEDE